MPRTSRVPYHQNVYDLLCLEPGESADAARMLAEHEAEHGPIPAALREWYLIPNMIPLTRAAGASVWDTNKGTIWYHFSNHDQVLTLASSLRQFGEVGARNPDVVMILCENQACSRWWGPRDSGDDPAVLCDNDHEDDRSKWTQEAASFSEFTFGWFADFGLARPWVQFADAESARVLGVTQQQLATRANSLWLRTPDEPFAPPVIDFLMEQFGEPERTPRPGEVTTYTFRTPSAIVRVTADEPSLPGALSAWWVHADTPDRLAELARLLAPWVALRADTDPARDVLRSVGGERPA